MPLHGLLAVTDRRIAESKPLALTKSANDPATYLLAGA